MQKRDQQGKSKLSSSNFSPIIKLGIIFRQASKARVNNHKEELVSCKRAATGCMRVCRLRAMQSQKAMKEIVWRAKRLTREMQAYWKRYDRVEKVIILQNELYNAVAVHVMF